MKTEIRKAFARLTDAENELKEVRKILTNIKEKEGSIMDRIKTVKDAFSELDLDYDEFIEARENMPEHIIALEELEVVVRALNEEEPEKWIDWENSSQYKWFNWFRMGKHNGEGFSFFGSDNCYADTDVGSRLVFKSKPLAEYAAKQFFELYKKHYTLNK